MKFIIGCTVIVLFVLFIGRTEISLSPFYIRMPGWQNVVGWMFLLFGFAFIGSDFKQRTYYEGFEDGVEYTLERIKDCINREEETK